ncbi:hypothetical protein UFOVP344_42 [uncultured Caudovirales phage]|uniref:Uncharacterized protein n=1 Tax=uncultured Caudovirales phage TaxID=2100421 RepID=A0A6J5M196_9CAUD|nr:hypothetical protein UFOVP344_42 [uncultured Caudovirales phage]
MANNRHNRRLAAIADALGLYIDPDRQTRAERIRAKRNHPKSRRSLSA